MTHLPALRPPAGTAALGLVLTFFAASAAPQSGHNIERPAHWKVRYDERGSAAERRFVVMRPGWHLFAGPGGLFWNPGSFASGAYGVSSTVFLFPEGDPDQSGSTRLDSPYGLFLGGKDLEGATPAYLAFEIRNDGRFRITEHADGATRELVPWTASDAVATMDEDAAGPRKNLLGVDIREDGTVFRINDVEVAQLPGGRPPPNGIIGLRAGPGLSLHVTEVEIGPGRRGE